MNSIEKMFEEHNAEESDCRTLPRGQEKKEEDLIAKQKPLLKKKNPADEREKTESGILPRGLVEKENVKPAGDVGEECGASKKTKEEKDGILPKEKAERRPPTIQICVTTMEQFGDKSISIVTDDAPWDFSPEHHLLYFHVKDKKLIKSSQGLVFSPIVKAPRVSLPRAYLLTLPKENREKKATTTITSATLKAWRRDSHGKSKKLQCRCHPAYAYEDGDHSNEQYCKCAAIAAAIAEQAWAGGKLEDTVFPEGVFE